MKAIIRTYYPDNQLQGILDGLGFANTRVLHEHEVLESINALLNAGLNITVLQDSVNILGTCTLIWVVKKGERFVQR
jgi:hypothetical protein